MVPRPFPRGGEGVNRSADLTPQVDVVVVSFRGLREWTILWAWNLRLAEEQDEQTVETQELVDLVEE